MRIKICNTFVRERRNGNGDEEETLMENGSACGEESEIYTEVTRQIRRKKNVSTFTMRAKLKSQRWAVKKQKQKSCQIVKTVN